MSVPGYGNGNTLYTLAADDASDQTDHEITADFVTPDQGGSVEPPGYYAAIVTPGVSVSSVTDSDGDTWYLPNDGTDDAKASDGSNVCLELWRCDAPTQGRKKKVTFHMASACKAKMALVCQDQNAQKSTLDGSSSPVDEITARIDTTNSTGRTSASTNLTKRKIMKDCFLGVIGWNDTRTISSAGSTWTDAKSLAGGSSNLGIAIERKSAEVQNIAGAQNIARFTMSASGTSPAAVISISVHRHNISTDNVYDGYVDNIEGTVTVYDTSTLIFVYRSSASAPNGGTGGSEYAQGFFVFPRYYAPAGSTIASTFLLGMGLSDGYDDGLGDFSFYLTAYKGTLTPPMDSSWNELGGSIIGISIDANNWTIQTFSGLSYSTYINPTGNSIIRITSEGDGLGAQTGNYLDLYAYEGNIPAWIEYNLTYPILDKPKTFASIIGA